MHLRPLRRSFTVAIAGILVFAGVASADVVRADGDGVVPGSPAVVDLGEVAPSTVLAIPVTFELVCGSATHVDAGQTISLAFVAGSQPTGGQIVSVTPAAIGPVPDSWVADGQDCPFPVSVLAGGTASLITLRAPSAPNVGYVYTIGYSRAVAPVGGDDASAIRGTTTVSFRLSVVTNTAPVLSLPADPIVEGDTSGGWTATYPGVSTVDAEDDPDPAPICSPVTGVVLPLGPTTVACSVTDAGGRTDSGSFTVTVVDTIAPALVTGGDLAVTTGDPAGVVLAYDQPVATDVVDADPGVACDPVVGAAIPVGTTTVTCTATDDSGNRRSAAFDVVVTHVADHVATVVWGEPVGDGTSTFVAQRGRTIPVKAVLAIDGEVRTVGGAALTITPCDGGRAFVLAMTYRGGRWTAAQDTSALVGSCHTVVATIDGMTAGSFELRIRGATPTSAKVGFRRRGG